MSKISIELIYKKQNSIIKDFSDNESIPKEIKDIILKNFHDDQQNYPEMNNFNYIKNANNPMEQYTKELGEALIAGYNSLTSSTKKEYRKDFFKNNYRCPICGRILEKSSSEGICNADLDHFLPKSIYPQFSLYPDNLIPICVDCNQKEKKDKDIDLVELKKVLGGTKPKKFKVYEYINYNFENNTISFPEDWKNSILNIYGLRERHKFIMSKVYNNLFNLIKHQNISSPEGLESFIESSLSSNMEDMFSDFSINNYPKIFNDFLDYILYDYNNLSSLWDELKEYKKVSFYSALVVQ